jgi:outer membrane protein, heavy metal efflux system
MSFRKGSRCAVVEASLCLAWVVGCASPPPPSARSAPKPAVAGTVSVAQAPPELSPASASPVSPPGYATAAPIDTVAQAAYRPPPQPLASTETGTTLDGQPEFVLGAFVQEVLDRNRSLQAMVATWRAASERYPQAIALDDPMFNSMTAPASWRSSDVTPAYVLGGSQKIPWMGKRKLRGQVAKNEANAAYMDVAEARLQLVQTAQIAFFEYYLVNRQLELNASNRQSLGEFRDTARRQYEANLVMQQDILQADVELADLARRQVELERMKRVAIARINTLMHLPPDYPVAPPPASLPMALTPAPVELLRGTALQRRPDLAAIGARLNADRTSLALAYKEFLPDFEVMGRYDSFWQPDSQRDLRTQVGVNMNVPIYLEKRRAAAREAMFKLSQRQAEYQQRIDDINNEVQSAYERVVEMRQVVDLYANRTLPAARQNVESARADYVAGKGDFLRLVSAQRQSIELREKHQEAIAEFHSRWADLERAVAGPVPTEAKSGSSCSNSESLAPPASFPAKPISTESSWH